MKGKRLLCGEFSNYYYQNFVVIVHHQGGQTLICQMLEKIKCLERDSNPRHPDLMKGALATELPRQPQWSGVFVCFLN